MSLSLSHIHTHTLSLSLYLSVYLSIYVFGLYASDNWYIYCILRNPPRLKTSYRETNLESWISTVLDFQRECQHCQNKVVTIDVGTRECSSVRSVDTMLTKIRYENVCWVDLYTVTERDVEENHRERFEEYRTDLPDGLERKQTEPDGGPMMLPHEPEIAERTAEMNESVWQSLNLIRFIASVALWLFLACCVLFFFFFLSFFFLLLLFVDIWREYEQLQLKWFRLWIKENLLKLHIFRGCHIVYLLGKIWQTSIDLNDCGTSVTPVLIWTCPLSER